MEVDPDPSRPPGRYDMWQASVENTMQDLLNMRGVLDNEEVMGEAARCIAHHLPTQIASYAEAEPLIRALRLWRARDVITEDAERDIKRSIFDRVRTLMASPALPVSTHVTHPSSGSAAAQASVPQLAPGPSSGIRQSPLDLTDAATRTSSAGTSRDQASRSDPSPSSAQRESNSSSSGSKHGIEPAPFPSDELIKLPPPEPNALQAGSRDLVDKLVCFNWAGVGWCVGTVVHENTDRRRKIDGKAVNYIIYYEIDEEEAENALLLESYETEWVLVAQRPRDGAAPASADE